MDGIRTRPPARYPSLIGRVRRLPIFTLSPPSNIKTRPIPPSFVFSLLSSYTLLSPPISNFLHHWAHSPSAYLSVNVIRSSSLVSPILAYLFPPPSILVVASYTTPLCSIMLSSTKASSTTLATTKFSNSNEQHRQSSSAPNGKLMKPKLPREVVLHHLMAPPPPEDWILFPEEVIITKNSSVRGNRPCKLKRVSRTENSHQPWIRRDRTDMESEGSRVRQDMQSRTETLGVPSKPHGAIAPTWEGKQRVTRNPPELKFPERLPTPDLSDVEEDGFWSCCGSSEESV